jgi:thiamine-phosphate pyrophosphorylase
VVAIGGINLENIADIARTGSSGVAVISAISAARDVRKATASLRESFLNISV